MTTKKLSSSRKIIEKIRKGPLTFGRMIESLRICDELSQVDLAKKMGMSKSYLCDIEKGRRPINPDLAARFAKVMKYDVKHFVSLAIEEMLHRAGLKMKVVLEAA